MAKDLWDKKITMHLTFTQKTNAILIEIAKEKEIPLSQVLEEILKESKIYNAKLKELVNKGYF